jgi:hypothetical protein
VPHPNGRGEILERDDDTGEPVGLRRIVGRPQLEVVWVALAVNGTIEGDRPRHVPVCPTCHQESRKRRWRRSLGVTSFASSVIVAGPFRLRSHNPMDAYWLVAVAMILVLILAGVYATRPRPRRRSKDF